MSVKRKRHIAKSITWRILASFVTFFIAWILTGDVNFGATLGSIDVIVKIILYYFHERMWYHSKFGIVDDGHKSYSKPIFKNKNNYNKERWKR